MSLKILLADDSMTAQNMGKKILADAGYDVIAVSNGAQAMKKIASEKPDLLLLDVNMPGYSGPEICVKVKAEPATANLPVLLTVSKLEPFKQEEVTKVRADGLIIKPFEAKDLEAAVKKLAARVVPKKDTVPEYERTVKIAAPIISDDEWKSSEAEEAAPAPPPVEMPAAVASAPAFDIDEPAPAATWSAEPAAAASAPPWDAPVAAPDWTPAAPITEQQPTPRSFFADAEPAATVEFTPPAPMPSFADELAAPARLEPTAAPPVAESSFGQAAGFEPTIDTSSANLSTTPDPSFVAGATGMSEFSTHFGVKDPEPVPVGFGGDSGAAVAPAPAADADISLETAHELPGTQPERELEVETGLAPSPAAELELEVEHEAVHLDAPPPDATPDHVDPVETIAPSEIVQPIETLTEVEATPEPPPPAEDPLFHQMAAVVSNLPVATTPVEDVVAPVAAPVAAAPDPAPAAAAPAAGGDAQFAAELAAAIGAAPAAPPESAVASAVAAVTATTGAPVDMDPVSRAVERVLDRFKTELIAEIMRELKP